jgi:hypothetical protein
LSIISIDIWGKPKYFRFRVRKNQLRNLVSQKEAGGSDLSSSSRRTGIRNLCFKYKVRADDHRAISRNEGIIDGLN